MFFYILIHMALNHVYIGNTKIDTTTTHPFWVVGKGWVNAGDLKSGDKVLLSSGKIVEITKVEIEKLKKKVKVYNFRVTDWHTYFVSNIEVLVHNANYNPDGQTQSANNLSNQNKEQLLKSKQSYEDLIKEHQTKLEEYIKDLYAHDNKGLLENAPSDEIRDKIFNGRVNAIQKQITKQIGELNKIIDLLGEE